MLDSPAEVVALNAKELAARLAQQRKAKPEIRPDAPNSPDAEKGILGSMLVDPATVIPAIHREVSDSFFFNPCNRTMFVCLIDLWESGGAVDLITFTQALSDRRVLDSVGGPSYVTDVATFVPTGANVRQYIEIAREKYVMRELIATGVMLSRATYGVVDGEQLEDVLSDFSRKIERIKREAGGPNGSEQFALAALEAFDARNDPNNLVGHRWLVRGAPSLLAGGSGYGKSSLEMQLAIYWACGRSCFGMRPVRPWKSLIVQAENDLGDMAEQFQGVLAGIKAAGELDLDEMKPLIERNVGIHRVIGKTGSTFLALLEALIEQDQCDIVWLDPLFAFSGCDLMNAEKAGRFLREGLFPIAVKRKVGLVVLHHVGKPARSRDGQEPAPMSEIDYQFLGFGSSEIMNAFRGINVLVPVSGTPTYKLVLSKRGERAGAKDTAGEWARTIYLEHSSHGIFWQQTDKPPEAKKGRKAEFSVDDLLGELSVFHPCKTGALLKKLHEERNMSRATFFNLLDEMKASGKVKMRDGGWIRKGFSEPDSPESPE